MTKDKGQITKVAIKQMAITQNYKLNLIQWYPGHIAKAEKNLKEQLKRVDVVLEVRDARIPLATNHPQINEWVEDKTAGIGT